MGTSTAVAYVWAIIISLVLLLLAAIIAYMIPNKPRGKDIGQRRVWFWVLFIVVIIASFGLNAWIASDIKIPSKHSAYLTASAIATGVAAVVYLIIGFGLSKGMQKSKLGSWF
ncbi:MAG: hypothetical protein K2J58_02770 [Muribaculaceae bacterium]|nr:hypothetical protein [Muribaculaceae bacterium]